MMSLVSSPCLGFAYSAVTVFLYILDVVSLFKACESCDKVVKLDIEEKV